MEYFTIAFETRTFKPTNNFPNNPKPISCKKTVSGMRGDLHNSIDCFFEVIALNLKNLIAFDKY